jgi:hypothetical protein
MEVVNDTNRSVQNMEGFTIGSEPSVFSSAVKKLKNQNIQDDNFACGSVWV